MSARNMRATDVRHAGNVNFSSSCVKKKKGTSKINFRNVFYLNYHKMLFQHVTIIKLLMRVLPYFLHVCWSLKFSVCFTLSNVD